MASDAPSAGVCGRPLLGPNRVKSGHGEQLPLTRLHRLLRLRASPNLIAHRRSRRSRADSVDELKADYTIAIVTHNMQQAARVSDFTAFMYLGELVEFDTTSRIFTAPCDRRTQDYITGQFG